MKHLIILFVTLFVSGAALAQDPFKDLKNAEKAIKKYSTDFSNSGERDKGFDLLTAVFANENMMSSSKALITKGRILKNLANADFLNHTLKKESISEANAAVDAYQAYSKAAAIADRKNELKEIELGLTELEGHLNNYAIVFYGEKQFDDAFKNFSSSLSAYDDLKKMGKKSRLDENEKLLTDQYFFTAVSGYYSENNKEAAVPYLDKLYADGSDEAFVYEALYNLNAESDPEKAAEVLEKGRQKNPDDTGLLFAQINEYLKSGETDKLIKNLDDAIKAEPDNVSIYNTLGSVYEQLAAAEPAKAEEHSGNALKNYNLALEKDPKNFDAQYNIGAMYYNKAATYVDQLNELASDLSSAGMKKYDATKLDMDGLFKQALPYFEKAEMLKEGDSNTIIALKEIYARMNNLEKSNEYKAKYDALGGN